MIQNVSYYFVCMKNFSGTLANLKVLIFPCFQQQSHRSIPNNESTQKLINCKTGNFNAFEDFSIYKLVAARPTYGISLEPAVVRTYGHDCCWDGYF